MEFWKNWQSILFGVLGLTLLGFCLLRVYEGKVTDAGVLFGMAFLSLLYSNVARFKKFKGLGFEAELWEDTQKQADSLIKRLQTVVSLYTEEVLRTRVSEGYISNGKPWSEHWKLYDKFVVEHEDLGQVIDFTTIKKMMDEYFLLDMRNVVRHRIVKSIGNEVVKARSITESTSTTTQNREQCFAQLSSLGKLDNFVREAWSLDIEELLSKFELTIQQELKDSFEIELDLPDGALKLYQEAVRQSENGEIEVNEEFIELASGGID